LCPEGKAREKKKGGKRYKGGKGGNANRKNPEQARIHEKKKESLKKRGNAWQLNAREGLGTRSVLEEAKRTGRLGIGGAKATENETGGFKGEIRESFARGTKVYIEV